MVAGSPLAQLLRQAASEYGAGRFARALELLQDALRIERNNPYANHLAGVIAARQGDHVEALKRIAVAVRHRPGEPVFLNSYGNALLLAGRPEEARDAYRQAIEHKPDYVEACTNLGNTLKQLGQIEEAEGCFRRALDLDPGSVQAWYHLGVVHRELGRADEAVKCFQRALEIAPDCVDVHYSLGVVQWEQGDRDAALACYDRVLQLNPDYSAARWGRAVAQLPAFYGIDDDPVVARRCFEEELGVLEQWMGERARSDAHMAVGSQLPFYIAYQEYGNRGLLARFGRLCVDAMSPLQRTLPPPQRRSRPSERARIRLGVVSAQIYSHSVWAAIVRGWFQHLDRSRFELHVFSLARREDAETQWARGRSDSFHAGIGGLNQWVSAIAASQPDVLIYPEIGMDPLTVQLASLRLAQVQIATWGHPETTGLPTIDYYLSAEDFEPPGAGDNYTEELVRLPHLGCCCAESPTAAVTGGPVSPDVSGDGPLLICPGAPFKYMPWHDRVFTEIARRLGRCRFVFFIHRLEHLSARLQGRLEQAFAREGLDFADYGIFVPWLERPAFHGLMERADLFLDTIGFSGFNTAVQAVECGLPIVTRDGAFLRGRLASGILRRIELADTIAASDEQYVDLAVRMVTDRDYQRDIRERMAAGRARIFDDVAPVRALEEFLESLAG